MSLALPRRSSKHASNGDTCTVASRAKKDPFLLCTIRHIFFTSSMRGPNGPPCQCCLTCWEVKPSVLVVLLDLVDKHWLLCLHQKLPSRPAGTALPRICEGPSSGAQSLVLHNSAQCRTVLGKMSSGLDYACMTMHVFGEFDKSHSVVNFQAQAKKQQHKYKITDHTPASLCSQITRPSGQTGRMPACTDIAICAPKMTQPDSQTLGVLHLGHAAVPVCLS